jgi:epoxide hydrolase-like predicted phosphatase
MSRYHGMILDFGGVLTASIGEWIGSFCRANGLDPARFMAVLAEEGEMRDAHHRLERGEIDEHEFEPMLAAALGVEEHDGLVEALMHHLVLDEPMVDVVRSARRQGLRTGLISNSFGEDRYDHDLFAELFDGVVISMHAGMRKPEPEIYLLGAERTGVAPDATVFVDDLPGNCAAAEAVGMTAVLHRDAAETIPRLEQLLGLSLR